MLTLLAASGPRNTTVVATLMSTREGTFSKKLSPGRCEDRPLL